MGDINIKKIKLSVLASFFNFTTRAISDWKKQNRPVILFLQKYFTEEDISQFLEKGRVDRLDYLEDTKNVTDFIIKEVFNKCKESTEIQELQEFGRFLETIQDVRIEKTWVDFSYFQENEKEIWNWIKQEYAKYLLYNNLDIESNLVFVSNFYQHFPIPYRYYYIKHFIWIFMPSITQKQLSQVKKIYASLPPYIQNIPGVKLIIKIAGMYGFLGFFSDKKT